MEGYLAEVRIFAGNFAPRSWAFCEGQLLPINSNQALFSLIGTIYGGDGRTTFGLPDLRGRTVIGPGNGPGLSSRREGQKGGSETNVLNVLQLPSHTHALAVDVKQRAHADTGTLDDPTGAWMAGNDQGDKTFSSSNDVDMGALTVTATAGNTGGSQPVNNMQPWLAVYYIICLQGIFPSRS
jgi:microcystin-dependent protein